MNRLIRLFQSKADAGLEKLVQHRRLCNSRGHEEVLGWTQSELIEAARLQAQHEVWQKAAELLRQEELHNGR